MGSIADMYVSLSLKADTFNTGLRGVQRELRATENRIKPTIKLIEGLSDKMRSAGKTMTLAITAPLAGIAALGLRFNAIYERSQISMTTMLGSGEKAKKFLEDMKDFAAKTPFEFEGLMDASKQMMAMGFSAQEVLPMLTALGDAAAGLGAGPEIMERMVMQLGQMKAKGKVQAEEMRVLAQTGIPVWELLAKRLGTDVAGAMDQVSKGAVSAKVGVDAIIKGIEAADSPLRNHMAAQSKSAMGLLSTFKDEAQFIAGDLTNSFFDFAKGPLKSLTDGMHDFRIDLESGKHGGLAPALGAVAAAAALAGPALTTLGYGVIGLKGLGEAALGAKSLALWLGSSALGLGRLTSISELFIAIKLNAGAIGAGIAAWAVPAALLVATALLIERLYTIYGLVKDINAAWLEVERATNERKALESKLTPAMIANANAASIKAGRGPYIPSTGPKYRSPENIGSYGETAGSFASRLFSGSGLVMYDKGTRYVPQTGPAILHKGEKVTPADQNRGGGGGIVVNMTINMGTYAGNALQFISDLKNNKFGLREAIQGATR